MLVYYPGIYGSVGGSAPSYSANPVNFDGASDYLNKTPGGFTGATDSKMMTFSGWFRWTGSGTDILLIDGTIHTRLDIRSGVLHVESENASSLAIVNLDTAAAIADTNWHHWMFSFDLSDSAKRHMYLDGASSLTVNTYVNDIIDFTVATWVVGATAGVASLYAGDMADIQAWFGTYVDLSQASNQQLFISGGAPVNPTVASGALGPPIVLLAGATSSWHTNQGSGGGFTENGALTDGTGPVQL